ncbi:hypothetical protein [Amycolatopsis sp. NPDC051716]|uniref:hypothetical protein n=1 Tax=Amycolatopsis sp. NPDC051716 TaxID=3155804 RepID=UPI003420165B
MRELQDRGVEAVVADLSDVEQTRDLAGRVNRLGRRDAAKVVTNSEQRRGRSGLVPT